MVFFMYNLILCRQHLIDVNQQCHHHHHHHHQYYCFYRLLHLKLNLKKETVNFINNYKVMNSKRYYLYYYNSLIVTQVTHLIIMYRIHLLLVVNNDYWSNDDKSNGIR